MTIPLPENTGPAGYNDFVPQPVSGWTSSIRNGNQFVTDSAGSRRYKLNETASLVLQLCDGKCTNREIIDTVDDLYESDPTCVSDVISVLSSLKNAGLISNYPSVTFATACWENDWRQLLLDETYLPCLMIDHHSYNFQERLLLINNVIDTAVVARHAQELVSKQILTSVHNTADTAEQVLEFFGLSRSLFVARHESQQELNVDDDWIYYNALAPLSAIYRCTTDYLLYMTGDCFLREPVDWIGPALRLLEENASYKVANPTWNDCYEEASRQSTGVDGAFYVSEKGFSDQCFLVATQDARAQIFNEKCTNAEHYPRGETFEKRMFCHMSTYAWKRLIYRHGSYWHQNIVPKLESNRISN